MHRIILSLLTVCLAADVVFAAGKKFPYEATIDVAEEFVRSGPGQKYYPTSKLRRGDRVSVHRHEPGGGWVMIAPPVGSFSWIQAEYIKRKQDDSGVLTENDVIVRVGSQFNNDYDWWQVRFSKGDTVEILGEQTFETERGPVQMLKIKPPANEYRWIMGKALLPAETPVRKPLKRGDIADAAPPKIKSPLASDTDPFADGPLPQGDAAERPARPKKEATPVAEATRQTGPDTTELEQMRAQLSQVDKEFHAMIEEDPAGWNLTGMEQQYQQLDELSELPAFKKQIKQRLDAVNRYAKIKTEYEEFVRVTTETKLRDTQLMSLKNQPGGETPNPTAAAPPARPAPAMPKSFDGAGIIQRSATPIRGAPQFVLVAPGGRLLAYLQGAPGVDLNAYVGRSMGVVGQRSFRQELQGELIVVRSLTPVRLKAAT